ncbi:MAG: response regulator transcription factor [Actinomycetota bacterium]|nr:response regulator transcription factor [Actinomycetota bacterium]
MMGEQRGDEPIKLVIVDDNAGIRTLLRSLAKRERRMAVVGEAENGVEAVMITRRKQPDVVILDVMMPVMDGLEAIPGIIESSPRTCIVMYSAYADPRDEAFRLGAHGWCTKGSTWDVMAETIYDVVAARDAREGS